MTTAHRPTWAPARGHEEQGGMRIFAPSRHVSAKNQAAHTKLKFRQGGQNAPHELEQQDLKAQLESKERKHFQKAKGINFEEERKHDLALLEAAPPDGGGTSSSRALVPNAKDADDVDADLSSNDSESDSDDDSDDEAELKAELERIRAERADVAERRAAEEEKKRQEAIRAEVLSGNPLMQGDVDFGVKRRWDEDVVFKNQTRGEVKAQRRFINDTVRSDFHRKFLERYVR